MNTPKWVVKEVKPKEDYTLIISFNSGEIKSFNAKALLDIPIYNKLKNISYFMTVKADGCSVSWDDEIDIAPEHLYNNSILI